MASRYTRFNKLSEAIAWLRQAGQRAEGVIWGATLAKHQDAGDSLHSQSGDRHFFADNAEVS